MTTAQDWIALGLTIAAAGYVAWQISRSARGKSSCGSTCSTCPMSVEPPLVSLTAPQADRKGEREA